MKAFPVILVVGVVVLAMIGYLNRRILFSETTMEAMPTDNSVALPFYPPDGHISLDGYFNANLGKEIFVMGKAVDSKGEPVIAINTMPRAEVATLYVRGVDHSWPADVDGKNVSMSGILGRDRGDEPHWVIEEATVVPLSGMYSVHQLSVIPDGTLELQWAVVSKLSADGEQPDNYYVDGIEIRAQELLV
jgi:hypothetical protein